MVKFNLTLNNDALAQLTGLMRHLASGGTLPGTAQAMHEAAVKVAEKWKDYAGGGQLPGVKPLQVITSAYARSIHVENKGPFDYEIVSNAPHAAYLEYGTKSIDFKKTHPYGPRSRQGENGPYVIVPFRWGTPGTSSNPRVGFRNVMPKAVYAIAKKFDMSHVNSETYFTPNAFGQLVERYTHDWGGRLRAEQTGGDDTMTGMVRSEGYTWTKGGQREQSSGYLTFRIISAKKPPDWDKRPHKKSWENTWKKPEQAPRPITGTIAKVMEPEVSKIIEQGIAEDSPL